MSGLEAVSIFLAGGGAGTINAVAGSGTLITFPTLVGFGYPPVMANVSNSLGLVPGSLSGAYGYRRELEGQRDRAIRFGGVSVLGGVTGAVLLLVLPAAAFKAIVPGFIALALVLVVAAPTLARRLAISHERLDATGRRNVLLGVYGCGIYGGYFGAAQGILLIALLGFALPDALQRLNALRNVLAMLANLAAGSVFALFAHVAWTAVLLIGGGAIVGGQIGARIGRRLPPNILRAVIVASGVAAIVKLTAT